MINQKKRPIRSRIVGIISATAVLSAIAVGVAPAANAATSGDPLSTGCSNGASTIWSQTYLGYGTVEVRYSPSCGTNWVRVTGATGRPAEAGISSPGSGWQYSLSYGSAPGSFWTPMVYAPGTTCITFYAKIVNGSGSLMNTGNRLLC